jgi:hypothetical protein
VIGIDLVRTRRSALHAEFLLRELAHRGNNQLARC